MWSQDWQDTTEPAQKAEVARKKGWIDRPLVCPALLPRRQYANPATALSTTAFPEKAQNRFFLRGGDSSAGRRLRDPKDPTLPRGLHDVVIVIIIGYRVPASADLRSSRHGGG